MKQFASGILGAVLGGGIGYAALPRPEDWAAMADPDSIGHFSFLPIEIGQVLIGAVIGASLAAAIAVHLAKRAATRT